MRPIHQADSGDRHARVEQMIELYRLAKDLRLEQRALTLWRKIEARQMVVELEKPIERIH